MASKKTLNAKNLEALGAKRLSELLIELSTGNAASKRRLRLELAGTESPDAVAKEVRKRLTTIARSRSFVDWHNRGVFVDDLETQRRAIVEQVAKADPAVALDLMWRFLALANSIFERCDDSSGTVIGLFHSACEELGQIAETAKLDPTTLADRTFEALIDNDYGQYDDLIGVLTPAMGQEGLEHLKQRMIALSKEPIQKPADTDRRQIGWSSSGPVYADQIAESARTSTVKLALKEIADAQGDVDAFIAQYDEQTSKVPAIAAEIARRLLAAGRAEEAWRYIEDAEQRRNDWPDFRWEDARIDVLEALGRGDEAQAARWSCFERSLSAPHLRSYLKQLPDFEDLEVEDQALDRVEAYPSLAQALSFLVSWPNLDRAANVVLQRTEELDGDHYEILTPAAQALAGKHPLAATLVLRAMIDFSLNKGRSSRYRHAARHLIDCESLASSIEDFGGFKTHAEYDAKLRERHGRKSSFWALIT
ncbi:MAG: hypothetical protein ISP41_17885 [Alphaproteobacteria bacterium]|nr:hypothetical protein [Alphaproteobacteria bacterium]